MEPLNYDFPPVTRGQPASFDIILKTVDVISKRLTVQDLTGALVVWTLRADGRPEIVKSTADGSLMVTPKAGRLRWSATSAETAAFADAYTYAVRVTLPSQDPENYLRGRIAFRD